jgi:hypothetical protein
MELNKTKNNDSSIVTSNSLQIFDDYIDKLTYDFIKPAISIFIFTSNLTCSFVFIKILKNNRQSGNKMYYYFFIKSLCDMVFGLIETFYPFYGIKSFSTSKLYITMLWYIYLHKYTSKVLLMASGFLEIVASFDCAIAMDKSMKWFQTWISFIFINIIVFLFCLTYNVYIILGYEVIRRVSLNNTIVEYKKNEKKFYDSTTYEYLHLMNSIFRDVVVVIILFIINLYILIHLKKIRERKTRLQKTTTFSKMIKSRAEMAENRKARMIYVLCLIYIFGHLPSVVYYMRILSYSYFRVTFYAIADIIYQLSYGTPLFVYYFFNNNFKLILNSWLYFKNSNSIEPATSINLN